MGDIVIELTKGLSPKKSMVFSPGKPAETFSLGQQGVWSVSGAGVGAVHAYLFFDGTTVFVASADPAGTTSVDGAKVSSDWFPLAPPCEVAVGEARLKVSGGAPKAPSMRPGGMIEENNPTMAMDPMKAMAMMGPPATPTAGESTRFQPDPAPPAFGQMAPMPGFGTPAPAPGAAPPPAGPPGVPADAGPITKLRAEWTAATPARRATILAIPCVLLLSYILFAEDEPETVTSTKAVASASAATTASAAPPSTRVTSPALPAAPAGTAAGGTPAAAGAAPPETGGPPRTGKEKDAPIKTTQRLAADAISAGNTAEALRLYQQLSKENPNDPAYKEAVRILKAKQ